MFQEMLLTCHSFTMPQDLWTLAPYSARRTEQILLVCSALLALRWAYGAGPLPRELDLPKTDLHIKEALLEGPLQAASAAFNTARQDYDTLREVLASAASIRNDAHLVEYMLACLDSALTLLQHASLFYAAAAYLVSLWMTETPRKTLLDGLQERF